MSKDFDIIAREDIAREDDGERALLRIHCPKGHKCQVRLRKTVDGNPPPGTFSGVWGWNGETGDKANVRPSINCTECGWHKTVINGDAK